MTLNFKTGALLIAGLAAVSGCSTVTKSEATYGVAFHPAGQQAAPGCILFLRSVQVDTVRVSQNLRQPISATRTEDGDFVWGNFLTQDTFQDTSRDAYDAEWQNEGYSNVQQGFGFSRGDIDPVPPFDDDDILPFVERRSFSYVKMTGTNTVSGQTTTFFGKTIVPTQPEPEVSTQSDLRVAAASVRGKMSPPPDVSRCQTDPLNNESGGESVPPIVLGAVPIDPTLVTVGVGVGVVVGALQRVSGGTSGTTSGTPGTTSGTN